MSPRARRAVRVVGSVALLAAVVVLLPAGSLRAALAQASPLVLGIALAIFLVCHLAAAFKWRMLMGPSADLTYRSAVRAHFSGLVGNLSPLGMIGGDLVRAGVAINGSAQPSTIMLTSVVDRIVDSIALVVLAMIGFLWIGGRSTAALIVLGGGTAVSGVGVGVLLLGQSVLRRTHDVRLAGIRDALEMLTAQPGLVARALLLSILVQASLITANAYIGASVGVESSFGAWLLTWPAAKFAGYLPIGVAGIGVRETALIALLRPFGGAPGAVMAAGLLWDVVIIAGAIGGWLMVCILPHWRLTMLRRIQTP
jgi:uncharacterized membrane protein YbhN (UPF0104 family)